MDHKQEILDRLDSQARQAAMKSGRHPAGRKLQPIEDTGPIDPFWGPKPQVGDEVYIDFGDSFDAHPEVRGECRFINDEFISVNDKRFRLDKCMHIEVI